MYPFLTEGGENQTKSWFNSSGRADKNREATTVIQSQANGLPANTAFGVFAGPIGDKRQLVKDCGSIMPTVEQSSESAFVILGIITEVPTKGPTENTI